MSRSDQFHLGTGAPLGGVPEIRERFARSVGVRAAAPNYAGVVMPPSATHRINRIYENLPDFDNTAVPAYRALRDQVHKQYKALSTPRSKGGLGLDIEVTNDDPYQNYGDLISDLRENNRIKTMSSASTGGHPFLSNDDNDMFRAIHDVFGHAGTGRGFDRHGEEAAYLSHARMFTPLARGALATETRGQNSYVATHGVFGPQKVATLGQQWTGTTPLQGRKTQLRRAAQAARTNNRNQGAAG